MKILIIANLDHASPRIPGLSQYLVNKKDSIRVVTPISSTNYKKKWALGELDNKYFSVIEASYSGDALQIIRNLLWRFGLARGKSLTEQLKVKQSNKENLLSKLPGFLLYKFQEFLCFPDLEITWYRSAMREAKNQIAIDKPDILISSSPYMTSHLVASRISKKYGLLWIADYRDTWANNAAYPFSRIRRSLDLYLEKNIIARANLITTVSNTYKMKLKEVHHHDPVVIPNGYTKLTMPNSGYMENNKILNITYTGTIYEGYQNFPEFLSGIRYALDNNFIQESDIQVNFYGRYIHELERQIHDLKLEKIIFQHGFVDRAVAFEKQSSCDLQLFFNWEGEQSGGLSHLKLYEYFGAMKPILVCGFKEDKINQDLVTRTNTGYVCIGKVNIANKLQELSQIKKDLNEIPHSPNMDELKMNSYYERGKLLRSEAIKLLS